MDDNIKNEAIDIILSDPRMIVILIIAITLALTIFLLYKFQINSPNIKKRNKCENCDIKCLEEKCPHRMAANMLTYNTDAILKNTQLAREENKELKQDIHDIKVSMKDISENAKDTATILTELKIRMELQQKG